MPGPASDIVILVDISSVGDEMWSDEVLEHIKDAVSFQISRGAITNRKLLKLGFEPHLARVKWAYIFVDATLPVSEQPNVIGRPLEVLTYEHWDLFEKDMGAAVKVYQSKNKESDNGNANVTMNTRTTNLMEILKLVKFPSTNPRRQQQSPTNTYSDDEYPDCECELGNLAEKYIFAFTCIPKMFSSLVHLARGFTECLHFLSQSIQASPSDIQICLVDLDMDPLVGPLGSGPNYCFWDELYEGKDSTKVSLKIACLKKLVMIHKLEELRHPWKYGDSVRLPFGFGMGMKRLWQLEWKKHQEPLQGEPGTNCLPLTNLRRCWSDEQ